MTYLTIDMNNISIVQNRNTNCIKRTIFYKANSGDTHSLKHTNMIMNNKI